MQNSLKAFFGAQARPPRKSDFTHTPDEIWHIAAENQRTVKRLMDISHRKSEWIKAQDSKVSSACAYTGGLVPLSFKLGARAKSEESALTHCIFRSQLSLMSLWPEYLFAACLTPSHLDVRCCVGMMCPMHVL